VEEKKCIQNFDEQTFLKETTWKISRCGWENNITVDHRKTGFSIMDWMKLA
jgi:hypothetical protein